MAVVTEDKGFFAFNLVKKEQGIMNCSLRKERLSMAVLLEKANRTLKISLTAKYINEEEVKCKNP